jgi:limonene-1,2-epoxide hydrolase
MSVSLTKEHVRKVIDTYIRAWTTQDPDDLIVTIFTPTATYHERVLEAQWCNEAGIRDYWETRVVKEEANIHVELLSLYLDGNTAIAEWEAQFDAVVGGNRKRMREVAILEFDGERVASLREYWTSETIGPALAG